MKREWIKPIYFNIYSIQIILYFLQTITLRKQFLRNYNLNLLPNREFTEIFLRHEVQLKYALQCHFIHRNNSQIHINWIIKDIVFLPPVHKQLLVWLIVSLCARECTIKPNGSGGGGSGSKPWLQVCSSIHGVSMQ